MCPPWGYRFPPIGLSYLSAFMKAKGYKVEVHDLNNTVYNAIVSGPFTFLWDSGLINADSVKDQTDQFFELVPRVFTNCIDRIAASRARFVGFSIHSRNVWVAESDEIVAPLKEQGLLTAEPFDEPIDFTYFDLWHHWGRTAKFGAWMQGPDYTQWHGAYEVLRELAELREVVAEKLEKAGVEK